MQVLQEGLQALGALEWEAAAASMKGLAAASRAELTVRVLVRVGD